jgi:hypothetical protein
MILDPVEPFATAASVRMAPDSVAVLPSVMPSLPEYESATKTGNMTLWYVPNELP